MHVQPGPGAIGPGPSKDLPGQNKKDQRFLRRATSPGPLADARRLSATTGPLVVASTLSPVVGVRARDKFVPLPDAGRNSQVVIEEVEDASAENLQESATSTAVTPKRGRITVVTVAESFNRKALEAALQQIGAAPAATPEAAASASSAAGATASPRNGTLSGGTAPAAASTAQPFARSSVNGFNGPNGTATTSASSTSTGATPAAGAISPAVTAAGGGGGGGGSGSGVGGVGRGVGGDTAVTLAVTAYPEVMYVRTAQGEAAETPGEVFFFDYGVVAFWGMTEAQEQALLAAVTRCGGVAVQLLDEEERQVEELLFVYSGDSPPNIRNDTFTIDSRLATDHQVKMAISHALAQSSKLSVYEERMVALVEEVRHIPGEMAERGSISLSRRRVAKLMGKVFLLKAAVNLTATMLGTPEFFWRAPDQLQGLYERACEYLDIQARLDTLNTRFLVLQRMLDIWSDHSAHQNLARLDVFIVVLILIEVVMAGMEVLGFILRRRGWHWHGPKLGRLLWGLWGRGWGAAVGTDGGLGAGSGAPAGW